MRTETRQKPIQKIHKQGKSLAVHIADENVNIVISLCLVPHVNTLVWDVSCHRNVNHWFSTYYVPVLASCTVHTEVMWCRFATD